MWLLWWNRFLVSNKYWYWVWLIRKVKTWYRLTNFRLWKSRTFKTKKKVISMANLLRRTSSYSYWNSWRNFARYMKKNTRYFD